MAAKTDVLVIGCGIAGAAAALRLAEENVGQVQIITRAQEPGESNTLYAQGGIVGQGLQDTREELISDIVKAGDGLCLPSSVEILAEEGPALVERILVEQAGVVFDREPETDASSYTREGGHTKRRILHVGDTTGRAIENALIRKLGNMPRVTIHTGLTAVDLITSSHHSRDPLDRYEPTTCHGAYVLDPKEGRVHRIFASTTILATGGLGRIYRHTTNPEGARGDGLAMAYRAGARVLNAEYVQFHPTTLAVPSANNFLISEAARGEGGKLYTPDGRHFMEDYAPKWGDLAPRDVVSRAIHHEMITHGYGHVLLDLANHIDSKSIRTRFPSIHDACQKVGIDITTDPIPVVPAAHYSCGGLQVDEWGLTNIRGLYAIGEVSCTGVHGANRLASTSLLEGLVWGDRSARHIAGQPKPAVADESDIPPWEYVQNAEVTDPVLIYNDRRIIQNIMWLYVGLSRNTHRLSRALRDLNHLWGAIDNFYRTTQLTDDLIGLRNMAQAAWIVASAAWHNRQSRGVHYLEDSSGSSYANFDRVQLS